MKWIFSFLYEYVTMPKDVGDDAHETRSTRSKLLAGALVMSLFLNGWIGWKVVVISTNHVKAISRIKELDAQIEERGECTARLKEAQVYLKLCLVPSGR